MKQMAAAASATKEQLAAAVGLALAGSSAGAASQAALDSAIESLVALRSEISVLTEDLGIVTEVSIN